MIASKSLVRLNPLYDRLQKEGRLTRPEDWLDFQAFRPAFIPKGISPQEAETEVRHSWSHCYEPAAFRRAQEWLQDNQKPFGQQLAHFVARLLFRGIYFPQMSHWAWIKLPTQNIHTLGSLVYCGVHAKKSRKKKLLSPRDPTAGHYSPLQLDTERPTEGQRT